MAISLPKIEKFETWAIVEVMGHNKFAGYVSEQTIAGKSFVRVDVPECGQIASFSKMFGPDSIYCITPVSELVAKSLAEGLRSRPLNEFDLPSDIRAAISQVMIDRKALPAPAIASPPVDDGWDDPSDDHHEDHDDQEDDDTTIASESQEIDESFLRLIGFKWHEYEKAWARDILSPANKAWWLSLHHTTGWKLGEINLPGLRTRGDLLSLLRMLEIESVAAN